MTNRARNVPFPRCLVATFALALLGAGPAVANIRHGISVGTTILGTNGGQWKASPDLTPGTHQLSVTAYHASSQFSTNAVSWFTNSAATDRAINGFDAAGQLTHKV